MRAAAYLASGVVLANEADEADLWNRKMKDINCWCGNFNHQQHISTSHTSHVKSSILQVVLQ